ncbi:hypothetical protein Tco_0467969 [Tanacetum coccineum]
MHKSVDRLSKISKETKCINLFPPCAKILNIKAHVLGGMDGPSINYLYSDQDDIRRNKIMIMFDGYHDNAIKGERSVQAGYFDRVQHLGGRNVNSQCKFHWEGIECLNNRGLWWAVNPLNANFIGKELSVLTTEDYGVNPSIWETYSKKNPTQISNSKKQLGQKDKIAFAHFRISDLEQIIEKIQARHQTDQEDL